MAHDARYPGKLEVGHGIDILELGIRQQFGRKLHYDIVGAGLFVILTLEIECVVREQTDRRINNAVGREMIVRRVLAVSTLLDIALAEGLAYLRELRAGCLVLRH